MAENDSPTLEHLHASLQGVLETAPVGTDLFAMKGHRLIKLRSTINSAIEQLTKVQQDLSPAKQPPFVLDPSDPIIVGKLVAETLLLQDRTAMELLPKFYGSGVYAIYYKGTYDAYQPIAGIDIPIYVGKADPTSAHAQNPTEQGEKLGGRLNEHRKNIDKAENLDIADFDCRFLVVTSGWQVAAEIHLLNNLHPLWNASICYGFGKHGDDAGTRKNARSPWDTLHPGRKWATDERNTPNPFSVEEIKEQIKQHFEKYAIL